jgi:hypothetical protein
MQPECQHELTAANARFDESLGPTRLTSEAGARRHDLAHPNFEQSLKAGTTPATWGAQRFEHSPSSVPPWRAERDAWGDSPAAKRRAQGGIP